MPSTKSTIRQSPYPIRIMNKKKAKYICRLYGVTLSLHRTLRFEAYYNPGVPEVFVFAFSKKTGDVVYADNYWNERDLHAGLKQFLLNGQANDSFKTIKKREQYYKAVTGCPYVSKNLFLVKPSLVVEWTETFFLSRAGEVEKCVRFLEDSGWMVMRVEKIKQGKHDTLDRKIIARTLTYVGKRRCCDCCCRRPWSNPFRKAIR